WRTTSGSPRRPRPPSPASRHAREPSSFQATGSRPDRQIGPPPSAATALDAAPCIRADSGVLMSWRRLALPLGLLLLAAAVVRGPLHLATFAAPVSNDDAIPLLMARHVLRGELSTTLWNQPYNGALDTYLLAPGLLLASAHTAFRLYELLCAAL